MKQLLTHQGLVQLVYLVEGIDGESYQEQVLSTLVAALFCAFQCVVQFVSARGASEHSHTRWLSDEFDAVFASFKT